MSSIAERHPRLLLVGAFVLGVALTLGYKEAYPDLERRYRLMRRRRQRNGSIYNDMMMSMGFRPEVKLKDNTVPHAKSEEYPSVPIGIEGLIGNTPLIKIKSLSEATGCDILAKAEVYQFTCHHVCTVEAYAV